MWIHLIVGIIMFACVMSSWMYEHKELVILGIEKWRKRRNQRISKND